MQDTAYRPTKLSRDRSFHQYYNEVGRTEMLTPEVELRYATRYVNSRNAIRTQTKRVEELRNSKNTKEFKKASRKLKRLKLDLEARDKLIDNCLRSIVKISAQYSRDPEVVKDLISAGNLGVFRALEKYDTSKRTRFLSYATYWIQFYIREELCSTETVAMPRWRQKAIRKMRQINAYYVSREGRKAEDTEMCAETDLSLAQLERLRRIGRLHFSTIDNLLHLHNVPKEKSNEIFDTTLDNETRETLTKLLTLLGPKENFVVRAYFGMCVGPLSLHQIAKILGVSSERVRQVKVIALGRLARYFRQLHVEHVKELCA